MTYKDKTYIIQLDEIWAKQPFNANPNINAAPPNRSKIAHGFDYGEKPSHSTFNWIMYKIMANAVAFQQNGILPWHATIRYQQGATAMYKDPNDTFETLPKVYRALKGDNKNTANIGHTPNSTNSIGVWWKLGIDDNDNYLKKDGNSGADVTGGTMRGIFVVKPGAQLIIEA